MKVCWELFNAIEIEEDGSVYLCCDHRLRKQAIGNIFKDNFDNIWNGDFVQKLREEALKGQYPHCNPKLCTYLANGDDRLFTDKEPNYKPALDYYPKRIAFPMGKDCNAKCIFCRDEIISSSKEEVENFNRLIDEIYIPISKNLEILTVNDGGDAFGSKFSRDLIAKFVKTYPNLKFKIMTNGICATKEFIQELNLENKMFELDISINTVNPETHYKIFRIKNGFNAIVKNLEYLATLKEKNLIPSFHLKFVVCNYNWKEMIQFVKFARKYHANCDFWEVRDYKNNCLENKIEDMSVHFETHPDYKKFKKLLSDPIFDSKDTTLSPVLTKIRNEEIERVKNTISYKIKKFFYNIKKNK
ncbi:SPASM domain-containing protein [bacterium]|nr:SPASM domain-containing protein [bacterium]